MIGTLVQTLDTIDPAENYAYIFSRKRLFYL